jgi:RNA recognition motif-containing protein
VSHYPASSNEIRTNETETIEINDGTKDTSATPTHLLLLRQLDHLSTEESIFNAVNSLQGVHRALLIRDKMTKMSCEFAFVEFYNVQVRLYSFLFTISVRLNGLLI